MSSSKKICRFADLRFANHIFLWFADLLFADPVIFCGHKTSAKPQIHKFYPYRFQLKMLSFKFKDDFWFLGQFWVTRFGRQKHNIRGKPMRIWIRNTDFFLANLWVCDLRTGIPRKFADLRFSEWHISELSDVCGLAIVEWAQELADLRFADSK